MSTDETEVWSGRTRHLYKSSKGIPFSDWPPGVSVSEIPEVHRNNMERCFEMAKGDGRRAQLARQRGWHSCARFWGRHAATSLAFVLWHRAKHAALTSA